MSHVSGDGDHRLSAQRRLARIRAADGGARERADDKLKTAPTAPTSVARRAGDTAPAEFQDAFGRTRLKKAEDRDNERLNIPHHMPIVIVIVMPSRQSEYRGGSGGGGMGRGQEVKGCRVSHGLPTRISANQENSALPKFGPCLPVCSADGLEPTFTTSGKRACSPETPVGSAFGRGRYKPSAATRSAGSFARENCRSSSAETLPREAASVQQRRHPKFQ